MPLSLLGTVMGICSQGIHGGQAGELMAISKCHMSFIETRILSKDVIPFQINNGMKTLLILIVSFLTYVYVAYEPKMPVSRELHYQVELQISSSKHSSSSAPPKQYPQLDAIE